MNFRLALPLILLLPATLLAWGGDGHQVVCLIAEEHLTPAAKAGIHELLGDAHISDAEIASWADDVRRERKETGPWHYVDIPVDARGFDENRDGQHGNNVIDQINHFAGVLADPKALKHDRADALKFLVHFVGDLHQPLHCAERDHDKGGNGRLVFFLDQPRAISLHSVWDTSILLHQKGRTRVLEFAISLNKQITAEQADKWATGTAGGWANESHAVAASVVYADVPARGPIPRLDDAYVARAEQAVDEQLERGGIRLAAVLNRCLAK